ncbi:hypothetical protein EVAR_72367_1, partial [Eumeta japonica]
MSPFRAHPLASRQHSAAARGRPRQPSLDTSASTRGQRRSSIRPPITIPAQTAAMPSTTAHPRLTHASHGVHRLAMANPKAGPPSTSAMGVTMMSARKDCAPPDDPRPSGLAPGGGARPGSTAPTTDEAPATTSDREQRDDQDRHAEEPTGAVGDPADTRDDVQSEGVVVVGEVHLDDGREQERVDRRQQDEGRSERPAAAVQAVHRDHRHHQQREHEQHHEIHEMPGSRRRYRSVRAAIAPVGDAGSTRSMRPPERTPAAPAAHDGVDEAAGERSLGDAPQDDDAEDRESSRPAPTPQSPAATADETPYTAPNGVQPSTSAILMNASPGAPSRPTREPSRLTSKPDDASSSTPNVSTKSRVRRLASHPASSPLTTRAPSTHVQSPSGISTSATSSAAGTTDQPTSMSSSASAVPIPPIVVAPASTSPGSSRRAVTGSSAKRSAASESSALTTIEPIHHPAVITEPTTTRIGPTSSGENTRSAPSPKASPVRESDRDQTAEHQTDDEPGLVQLMTELTPPQTSRGAQPRER